MSIWKERKFSRGIYYLESAKGGTGEHMKKKQVIKGTHILESAEGEASEDMERKKASEGHSRPGERKERDKWEHGKER